MTSRRLPECWGHRGASARFPENTLASFEAAIRDGAEGLESDVHVSTDQVIVMFHDPTLERTTDGTGAIKNRNYYGPDGMEHCRTRKEPRQPIPTFVETIALLMQPDNRHVKFNIDVKVNNEPHQLFTLMRTALSAHPNWEVDLAPRLLIGLWHPSFIAPCKEYLPHCRRSFIGTDINVARRYFWSDVDAFSVLFYSLSRSDGQAFIKECQRAQKQLCVWTVNNPDMMMEAVKWNVDAILTDRTQAWLDLRNALRDNYGGLIAKQDRTFLWKRYEFWLPFHFARISLTRKYLEMIGGPFNAAEQRGVLERWAESLGAAFGALIMKYFPPRP